eukprot:358580-Chlamydomonas_euryale.AAC.4
MTPRNAKPYGARVRVACACLHGMRADRTAGAVCALHVLVCMACARTGPPVRCAAVAHLSRPSMRSALPRSCFPRLVHPTCHLLPPPNPPPPPFQPPATVLVSVECSAIFSGQLSFLVATPAFCPEP